MSDLSTLEQLFSDIRELFLSIIVNQPEQQDSWWQSFLSLWGDGLLSLSGWAYVYVLVGWILISIYLIRTRWRDQYQTKWYRPKKSKWTPEPGWKDVKKIILGEPLKHRPEKRWTYKLALVQDSFKTVGLMLALWFLAYSLPFWLNSFTSELNSKENQTFLIYLIGGGSVAVTLAMALMQFRAKVKAENRQKWIDKFRIILSEVLANLPDENDFKALKKHRRNPLKYPLEDRLRLKKETCSKHVWLLELMINPSEKDHRTLVTMLRMLQAPYNGSTLDNPLIVDKKVLEKIPLLAELDLYDTAYDSDGKNDRETLLTYTINLFHAVLKKEWERVKRGI